MAYYGTINGEILEDIADKIREKTGESGTISPSEMPAAIDEIDTGGITPTGSITITKNGTVDVTQYAQASVSVQSGSSDVLIFALDNPNNSSKNMSPFFSALPDSSYVFLFADNQTTNITIGGETHLSADITIGTNWPNTSINDNVYAFIDTTDSFDIALNKGDDGNHVCTIIAVTGLFDVSYMQTMVKNTSASQVIGANLSEAYVLVIFCVYGGGNTTNIDFMGNTISVPKYTDRYDNNIYVFAQKLTNLYINDVVEIQISAQASSVIGIMGIFGNY